MAMISIDGVDLPAPSDYDTPNFNLHSDDSHRNELGEGIFYLVRSDIYKLELKWKGITSPEVALIKSAISPPEFKVTIITEIGRITKIMYPGDRSQKMVKYSEDIDKIRWDFSVNLTEV
ncbi:hypothetical protein CIW83_18440 [Tissierella sp. P1]|uniref:hypothetical protein n=1 Tax=Tissierella sp. P1 TaxID=1280483 RepID=UPI000BA03FBC|nr:hypothetical protein [Tissierella sp. P1]OZV10797.1 hypothetical protein CIW83_18440 [Tissierella sp. P1]